MVDFEMGHKGFGSIFSLPWKKRNLKNLSQTGNSNKLIEKKSR